MNLFDSLFDKWVEDAKARKKAIDKADKATRPKGEKCSTCKHHIGHEFSPRYHYCTLGRSKHTSNGYAKISPRGWCAEWRAKP